MASGGGEPFLPPEITINILYRLPVKSIVRFQCVCKEWKNLFKTPSFIAEHLHHSDRKNPFLLLHEFSHEHRRSSLRLLNHKMETVEVLSIPSIDSFRRSWRIIGSCNGLLCVQVDDDPGLPPGSLWLWNPVIREVREVPNTWNGYRRFCSVGFGFSSVVNDYKIVRFYNQLDEEYEDEVYDRAEVYSVSTGSWTELEFGALEDIESLFESLSEAVSADGSIFWLVSTMVVSFDIATEVFTVTQIPTEDGIYPLGLGVYENKLAGHYGIVEDSGSNFICLWVMEEVASESGKSLSCTQKYRIEQVSHYSKTLCIWRNEIVYLDKEYVTEVEGDPTCVLYLLNLITNEERKFNCSTACDWCEVFNYEKSLVSVWNTQQLV